MINHEACRKGGLARVNGLRCKCGRFLKSSESKCGRCRTNEFIKDLIQAFENNLSIANHSGQPIFLHPGKDFKTGDVWEEGKKEKDAVRKYAEEQESKFREEVKCVERKHGLQIAVMFLLCLLSTFGAYYIGLLAGAGR